MEKLADKKVSMKHKVIYITCTMIIVIIIIIIIIIITMIIISFSYVGLNALYNAKQKTTIKVIIHIQYDT